MAEIPTSTPSPDAAEAQTRRGTVPLRTPAGRPQKSIEFEFGKHLLPHQNAPERRRRKKDDPLYRPLHIFALDPMQPKLDGKIAVVNVPWEELQPGPVGRLFEVDSTGPAGPIEKLDLDDRRLLLDRGIRPTTSGDRFHRQMVYAVCSSVYNAFFRALGRDLSWAFQRERLLLSAFAFEDKNAFYDPEEGALKFGYFTREFTKTASDTVYTSLSHDIIAHELTHALLDGLRRNFTQPTNPDVLAFHEALADLVAIFHHFSYPEVVRAAIRDSGGNLLNPTILSSIARQFGEGLGKHDGLRTAIDFKEGAPEKKYGDVTEPHDLGAVLVAAVFDTFTRVFTRKSERIVRIAGGIQGNPPHDLLMQLADQASKIATQFLVICIRAIDYCPPVDITFGEFLRAVITADHDLVPDDPWAYREAWLDAFRLREIYPDNVRHMSEDAIEWESPKEPVTIADLNFAALNFSGDPAHVVSRDEMQRQANVLGREICRPDRLEAFGLVDPTDPGFDGDEIGLPVIESIRSSRRIGPDGQITFDLIAEVMQLRKVTRNGRAFPFYGGSTIIIGPDGDVRYVIGKSVRNQHRLEAQSRFIDARPDLWIVNGDRYAAKPQPFRFLHQLASEK